MKRAGRKVPFGVRNGDMFAIFGEKFMISFAAPLGVFPSVGLQQGDEGATVHPPNIHTNYTPARADHRLPGWFRMNEATPPSSISTAMAVSTRPMRRSRAVMACLPRSLRIRTESRKTT